MDITLFTTPLLSNLLSTVPLAFSVIAIGYCIGQIKIFHISLDLAGVLIAAVAAGYIINTHKFIPDAETVSALQTDMKLISSLGTALFVSVVGITTGYSLDGKDRKALLSVLVGAFMVSVSFAVMLMISHFDPGMSFSNLIGALCGALTTTPGLSAVCELDCIITEEAVLSYGCTYLFGVICTVLFVQISSRKGVDMSHSTKKTENTGANYSSFDGVLQISLAIILGFIVGSLRIPGLQISLGNAGGILCAGIGIGFIIKKFFPEKCAAKSALRLIRSWGLILFFAGNGIPAGILLSSGFTAKTMLYGILMTILPILFGWLLCDRILAKNATETAALIAGGMTSTPAIGVLAQKGSSTPLASYSMAYVGALLTIVLLIRFLSG